jgi:hypothetical protein
MQICLNSTVRISIYYGVIDKLESSSILLLRLQRVYQQLPSLRFFFCATTKPQTFYFWSIRSISCLWYPSESDKYSCFGNVLPTCASKWTVQCCYEYCVRPRGTAFRAWPVLTADQASDSFKTCFLERATNRTLYLMRCSAVCMGMRSTRKTRNFVTTKYRTGSA